MQAPKKLQVSKRRAIVTTTVITLTVILLIAGWVQALTTQTLSGGPNAGAPTYTIFQESGITYAKDAYGAIAWSDSNAATVINAAVSATTEYGTVKISGLITTTEPILVSKNRVTLDFDGRLYYTGTDYAIKFDGSEATRQYSSVVGAYIYLATSAAGGIQLYNNTYYNTIQDCLIEGSSLNSSQVGIALTSESSGVYWNKLIDNTIRRIGIGILLNTEGTENSNANILTDNIIRDPYYYGIKIESGYGHDVKGGRVESNTYSNVTGIYVNSTKNTFSGITFELIGSGAYAYYLDTGCNLTTVIGGDFNTGGSNIIDEGTQNNIYHPRFDRTILSITNTTANTFTFTTGLPSKAASSIVCAFDAITAAAIQGYSWNSTTTTATVTVYAAYDQTLPGTMTITNAEVKYVP